MLVREPGSLSGDCIAVRASLNMRNMRPIFRRALLRRVRPCIGKLWYTVSILAPLTFRPLRLHKYYNPPAPWLVALNQINM